MVHKWWHIFQYQDGGANQQVFWRGRQAYNGGEVNVGGHQNRRRQARYCCGGVDETIKEGVVSKIENNTTIKWLSDIAA